MIPNNLPYAKLPRDEIDTENLTWFDYIIGRFSGEIWWERDVIDATGIDPMYYSPIPFPEEPNNLHFWFFGKLQENECRTNIPWLESGHRSVEGLYFYPDTQCRFDIWSLYNYPSEQVNLEIGGAAKISTLPKQEDVKNVLSLDDTVPPDVPLIFGPQLFAPSIPHRPFVRNNPEISNFTTIENRIQEQLQEKREKKKRQQRQYAQRQRKKREKYRNAQRQKKQRSRRRARRGRRVPKASCK